MNFRIALAVRRDGKRYKSSRGGSFSGAPKMAQASKKASISQQPQRPLSTGPWGSSHASPNRSPGLPEKAVNHAERTSCSDNRFLFVLNLFSLGNKHATTACGSSFAKMISMHRSAASPGLAFPGISP